MPTYHNRGEYLLVEVSESYKLDLYLSIIHEVADRCRREGVYKVLIDFSQAMGDPSIVDRYTLGNEIARVWKYKIQGAGIAQRDTINYVMENVAVNRGANVKAFTARQDALKWLDIRTTNELTGE